MRQGFESLWRQEHVDKAATQNCFNEAVIFSLILKTLLSLTSAIANLKALFPEEIQMVSAGPESTLVSFESPWSFIM